MGRLLDVEIENERIKIDFPYQRELVEVVRTLPDRSFDNRTKSWFVPLKHLEYVIDRLEGYHFKFSPRLRQFRAGRDDGSSDRRQRPAVPEGTWTVSRLNHAARKALQQRFDEIVWVVGELQDYDKNRSTGYPTYFFELVERPCPDATEVAKIRAVMFEEYRDTVEKKLRDADIELTDGTSVRLAGRIDLYAKNGSYQLRVEDVDPAYTAGEIELNRERVFRALKARGIASDNLQLGWPACPMNVGLITSYNSDAYNDFVHQLRESGAGCSLTVHHANVQGVNTEPSVVRALEYFRERAADFDVIAIVRGGGSRSELAHFDTEKIGEAICEHPVKIICGIGHQRDTCLLDMIAESTKTPTAAAARIGEKIEQFSQQLDTTYARIARKARRRVQQWRQRLVRGGNRLQRLVSRRVAGVKRRHERLADAITTEACAAIRRRHRSIDDTQSRLQQQCGLVVAHRRRSVDYARRQLSMRRLQRRFDRRRRRLDQLVQRLRKSTRRDTEQLRRQLAHLRQRMELLDPHRVLERGFALVSDGDNIVRSRHDIAVGHDFDVMFEDGVLRARRLEDDEQSSPQRQPISQPEPVD